MTFVSLTAIVEFVCRDVAKGVSDGANEAVAVVRIRRFDDAVAVDDARLGDFNQAVQGVVFVDGRVDGVGMVVVEVRGGNALHTDVAAGVVGELGDQEAAGEHTGGRVDRREDDPLFQESAELDRDGRRERLG